MVGTGALCFIDFYLGAVLFFTISFGIWLFNLIVLLKRKITRETLYLNLICGSLMISSSILAQIAQTFLVIGFSFLNSFLIIGAFSLGVSLIANSIRFYRRRDLVTPEEPAPPFSTKHYYAAFLCISVFGIATYILLMISDMLMMVVFGMIAFTSIFPLNYLLRRYFRGISSTSDKQFLDKIKPFVMVGMIGDFIVFIVIFILFLSGVTIPYNTLWASGLILFEIFMVLYYIAKYFYFPDKLR